MHVPNNFPKRQVAYFSMEVGLSAKIPTYSGGLGILAGDTLKAAADVQFPLVGITLLSKKGYFFQHIKDGKQVEEPANWSVDDFIKYVPNKVKVWIGEEEITIGCWVSEIYGASGAMVPLYWLHTDLEENSEYAKDLTNTLYGDGPEYRIQQEIILGVGGVRMLESLGHTSIQKYHMNEGHAAFLTLELHRVFNKKEEVKNKCIFTTHTPVPAGHDRFNLELVKKYLNPDLYKYLPQEQIDFGELNMTALALDHSNYINGVAKVHAEVSKTMFPNYPIHSITNGIHSRTWASPHFTKLFDKYIPNWRYDSMELHNASKIPLEEIAKTHFEAKMQVVDLANAYSNAGLDYDAFTVGWARRFTAYKRPDFILEDLTRLTKIANEVGPIQLIYAGKAHPKDLEGKELLEKTIALSKDLNNNVKMVYLHNYDMYLSRFITAGVDVWLNTPLPPHEASGTSGMKAALNGVPHLSVLDGWWQEGLVEGETGWAFTTVNELYDLLENKLVPCFYNTPEKWNHIRQKTIMLNGSYFNSHRMIKEYIDYAYKLQINGEKLN